MLNSPQSETRLKCWGEEIRARLPGPVCLLDWDSHHFGFPVGRIDSSHITDTELCDALDCARHAGLRLVYWFAHKNRLLSNELLDRHCGALVDSRATFKGCVDDLLDDELSADESEIAIRKFPSGPATDDLLALGVLAGRYSRFNVDPRVPHNRFEELFHRWVDRSTRRDIADCVFVAETAPKSISGFVTVGRKLDNGVIGLIAVSEAAQGRRLGRRLMDAAHHWMGAEQIAAATVVTQLANGPACRLYQRIGYELTSVEPVYHFWLKSNGDRV